MKLNGKYFVAPKSTEETFKELFARLASEGAGRPYSDRGGPDGPWTPETLAAEISSIDANRNGIDVRAVQLWFQENNHGISSANIRWLARIFGCGDPKATSGWQKELTASKERLAAKRRAESKQAPRGVKPAKPTEWIPTQTEGPTAIDKGFNLPLAVNRLLIGDNNEVVLIIIWVWWAVLALTAATLGLGELSYMTKLGVEKEIGFFRSPTWTVEKAILIPVFFWISSQAVVAWLLERERLHLEPDIPSWEHRLLSHQASFVVIILASVFVVFGLQWYGNYLRPILDPVGLEIAPNWIRVGASIENASRTTVIAISLAGGAYIGFLYWVCFSLLLITYVAASDICHISGSLDPGDLRQDDLQRSANALLNALYRLAICTVFICIVIKVSVIYLNNSETSLGRWLLNDFLYTTGQNTETPSLLGITQPAVRSSLLFLVFTLSGLALCAYRVLSGIGSLKRHSMWHYQKLLITPSLLVVCYSLIGLVPGFSIALAIVTLLGLWQLITPSRAPVMSPG